ncbi:hypothetical protein [uncultured Polaribacter sp.]|uniref:hypothetical protein n=1 Tax=uncultured Polaribacter sp. TaxID=174711 RepID=UPI002620D2F5|nr:hypothetical protein [uncultured Polaribacter sp.]
MEMLLQFIILLLLLILWIDRFRFKKARKNTPKKTKRTKKSIQIMGKSKVALNKVETVIQFDEVVEKKANKAIPTAKLDTIFNSPKMETFINPVELLEEEEELKTNFSVKNDTDFATGLSFEELQKIPALLTQEEPTPDTLPLAVKIADTALLEMLNKLIPEAQERVSELLDKHLAIRPTIKKDWRDFDIQEFV